MYKNKISSVVFLSSFFNHHQKPFSEKMYALLGDGYKFIEAEEMNAERKSLGYREEHPPYVVSKAEFDADSEKFCRMINEADIVIIGWGSAPDALISQRIQSGKLIFRYSERPLKNGFEPLKYPVRFIKWHKQNPVRKPIYMLSASAYTARDFALFGLFRDSCYKWGYFPETVRYGDVDALISSKEKGSIVWVARYIDWKHPELAIELARRLKNDGYDFKINMIGNGELLDTIKAEAQNMGVSDRVNILGSMSPNEVREHMKKAEIHIFTSDRREGWGAVLNESMNSACVPVANKLIGSVPFLINDGKNGLIYNNADELYLHVKGLLDDPARRVDMSRAAYKTVVDEWNADVATERLLLLSSKILDGEISPEPYGDGVCSRAK